MAASLKERLKAKRKIEWERHQQEQTQQALIQTESPVLIVAEEPALLPTPEPRLAPNPLVNPKWLQREPVKKSNLLRRRTMSAGEVQKERAKTQRYYDVEGLRPRLIEIQRRKRAKQLMVQRNREWEPAESMRENGWAMSYERNERGLLV